VRDELEKGSEVITCEKQKEYGAGNGKSREDGKWNGHGRRIS
jgi:hypothetical protein